MTRKKLALVKKLKLKEGEHDRDAYYERITSLCQQQTREKLISVLY